MSFLANQRREQQRNANRSFLKDGVRNTKLSNQKSTSVFRVMPAFDPENPDPSTSYLPSVDIEGNPTDWARFVFVSVFLGHGMQKRDIVSPKTFNPEADCPLEDMWSAVYEDKATWQYLVKDDESRGTKKCFTRPNPQLLINAIDRNQTHMGSQIGILSKSGGNALLDMAVARNTNAQVQALIAQDPSQYLMGFANGDITDPNGGTMLTCGIPQAAKNGEFSEYVVAPLTIQNPMTRQLETQQMPLTQELMAMRYNLANIEDLIQFQSYEDIVKDLVSLYNKRSPVNGCHEFYLLRAAFPDYTELIPEPPPAPAGSNTVVSGWEPEAGQPVQPQPGGFGKPGGFGPRPGAVTPTAAQPQAQTSFQRPGGFAPKSQTPPPDAGVSSEKAKLAEIASTQPIETGAGQGTAPTAPGDPIPPYPGAGTEPKPVGDVASVLARVKKTAKGQA